MLLLVELSGVLSVGAYLCPADCIHDVNVYMHTHYKSWPSLRWWMHMNNYHIFVIFIILLSLLLYCTEATGFSHTIMCGSRY